MEESVWVLWVGWLGRMRVFFVLCGSGVEDVGSVIVCVVVLGGGFGM